MEHYVHASQHTLMHVRCEACSEIAWAKMSPSELAHLPLSDAARIWLDSRRGIDETTRANYRCYIAALLRFTNLPCSEITIGHIQTYQLQRQRGEIAGLPRKAGASVINHELNTLQQIMTRAGEWARLADWYEPIPLALTSKRRALTPAEERRLFEVASSRPRWQVAYYCIILTVNTTAGAGEIRRLRLRDVELDRRLIHIREGAKNDHRIRSIPLNGDALYAARMLLERALRLGASNPDHYLLPHKSWNKKGAIDFTRPAGGWRTAWQNLRKAAGLQDVGYHGLRHHSITKLLEDPQVPERAVIDLAGHVSNRMLDTYSHVRREVLRNAVDKVGTNVTQTRNKGESVPCMEPPRPVPIQNLPVNSQPRQSHILQGSSLSTCFWGNTLLKK